MSQAIEMNTTTPLAVERSKRRRAPYLGSRALVSGHIALFIGLITCLLSAIGCVEVNGGAIELSWTLRSFTGEPISDPACASAQIDNIRVWWRSPETGEMRFRAFPCTENRGVTGFQVPAGANSIWVTPECAGGIEALPGTFDAPAPLLRTVEDGAVVTLNTVLLVVSDRTLADDTQCPSPGCTCGP